MNDSWRNELITKGAAFDALTEVESHYEFEDGHDHLMRWAKTKVMVLPSEQSVDDVRSMCGECDAWNIYNNYPRMKGKWIDKSGGIEGAWNYCSVCGEQAIDLYDFCPNCGADMRGDEDAAD